MCKDFKITISEEFILKKSIIIFERRTYVYIQFATFFFCNLENLKFISKWLN
jgi:hypothetical protein